MPTLLKSGTRVRIAQLGALLCLLVATAVSSAQSRYDSLDPPSRVARLSYHEGDVSFSPAGSDEWAVAILNRPLIRGDRLWTDDHARAELQLGGVALRVDELTSVTVLDMTDAFGQFELTEGRVNLFVSDHAVGQSYEIATPTLALSIDAPGSYTVEVGRDGRYTEVQVWKGHAEAFGDRARFELQPGDAIRFHDPRLQDQEFLALRSDDFHRFSFDRDRMLEQSESLRYVSNDVIGYEDLDRYGRWRPVSDYGHVWFPTRIDRGWAPYRNGHWIWQAPWGWTWVDDAPWGFAPFHYGRWVSVGGRWGWLPTPPRTRAVYAPALVAFLGGDNWSLSVSTGSQPVGWFPLGPRDVYIPWYRVSRDYFTRVNYAPTRYRQADVGLAYQRYYIEDRGLPASEYSYRRSPSAVTVVPRDVIVRSQPVHQSLLAVDSNAVTRAEVRRMARIDPGTRNVFGAAPRSDTRPRQETLNRQVLARHAPTGYVEDASPRSGSEAVQYDRATRQAMRQAAIATESQVRVVDPSQAVRVERGPRDGRRDERGDRREARVDDVAGSEPAVQVDGRPAPALQRGRDRAADDGRAAGRGSVAQQQRDRERFEREQQQEAERVAASARQRGVEAQREQQRTVQLGNEREQQMRVDRDRKEEAAARRAGQALAEQQQAEQQRVTQERTAQAEQQRAAQERTAQAEQQRAAQERTAQAEQQRVARERTVQVERDRQRQRDIELAERERVARQEQTRAAEQAEQQRVVQQRETAQRGERARAAEQARIAQQQQRDEQQAARSAAERAAAASSVRSAPPVRQGSQRPPQAEAAQLERAAGRERPVDQRERMQERAERQAAQAEQRDGRDKDEDDKRRGRGRDDR